MPRFGAAAAAAGLVGAGCGAQNRPPEPGEAQVRGRDLDGSFAPNQTDGPPDPDAQGLCGNQYLMALSNPPNLYFIVDRSGSMSDPFGTESKSLAMRIATVGLVRRLGAQVNIGAAMFPGPAANDQDPCSAVHPEVFPMQPGDVGGDADADTDGPVTSAFSRAINLMPFGGTPTAAAFVALTPTLLALSGRTFVILATDGGPNCNSSATCGASQCIANIEGNCAEPDGTNCCAGNCCDPTDPTFGPDQCLDVDTTTAGISGLRAAGIPTYVIGLPSPGSSSYAPVLDAMAVAGGTARSQEPLYYAVNAVSELDTVLSSIQARVILSCDITLAQEPPDKGKVNIYLDQQEIAQDPQNGWVWASPTTDTQIELVGSACDDLMSGQVRQVQLVSGCPTKVPK